MVTDSFSWTRIHLLVHSRSRTMIDPRDESAVLLLSLSLYMNTLNGITSANSDYGEMGNVRCS